MEISPCPYCESLHIDVDRARTVMSLRPNPDGFPFAA
jgi:hypothetical protein